MLVVVFFFEGYGDHRDLHVLTHSFPTRRSSDLQLEVTLPEGWTGVAALDGLKVSGGRYSFAPTNYAVLVDSPMFAGKYFRKWDLGNQATLNVVAAAANYQHTTTEHIARHHTMVVDAGAASGVEREGCVEGQG